jgi:hypothetical protein
MTAETKTEMVELTEALVGRWTRHYGNLARIAAVGDVVTKMERTRGTMRKTGKFVEVQYREVTLETKPASVVLTSKAMYRCDELFMVLAQPEPQGYFSSSSRIAHTACCASVKASPIELIPTNFRPVSELRAMIEAGDARECRSCAKINANG